MAAFTAHLPEFRTLCALSWKPIVLTHWGTKLIYPKSAGVLQEWSFGEMT